jgi:hypothetical protein
VHLPRGREFVNERQDRRAAAPGGLVYGQAKRHQKKFSFFYMQADRAPLAARLRTRRRWNIHRRGSVGVTPKPETDEKGKDRWLRENRRKQQAPDADAAARKAITCPNATRKDAS